MMDGLSFGYFANRPREEPWRDFRLSEGVLSVLRCHAAGMNERMTAEALSISAAAAHDRMRVARMKLGAKTQTHAVAIAMRHGLIT